MFFDTYAILPYIAVIVLPISFLQDIDANNRTVRFVGSWLTIFLLVRYIIWRATHTLGAFDYSASSFATYAFFVVEVLSCIATILLMHVLSKVSERSAEADAKSEACSDLPEPLVDVLIPSYNEEREILRRTIIGALAQNYSNYRVWVLDDGKRDWLAELAAELGAFYRTRTGNAHGKAGNMNATLDHLAGLDQPPELIAVLDADFVAGPNFLSRCIPLFQDAKVGVVQTPQHFFNPDPIQLNLKSSHLVPDEQRFFFDAILPSKDAHGTAFCCGTSSIVRFECLNKINGFPIESITEDMLLSIKLAGLGYRTAYLNEPLTAGLAPEGLKEYLTQRSRWCIGAMQIIRSKWGPFSPGPTPLLMRLHTFDTLLFWTVSPVMRILSILMPILYWPFGLTIMHTNLNGILQYFAPYWLSCVIYLGWVSRGSNLPILTDATALLGAKESIRASMIGLFGSKNQKFVVTAKGLTRNGTQIQWSLAKWFALGIALTLLGIFYTLLKGPDVGTTASNEVMTLFWSCYNILILLLAFFLCIERPRFRTEERFATNEPIQVSVGNTSRLGKLIDISTRGCRFHVLYHGDIGINDSISLNMPKFQHLSARVVESKDHIVRVEFEHMTANSIHLIKEIYSGNYFKRLEGFSLFQLMKIMVARYLEA